VHDRLLLAALGCAELLAALRADVPGVDGHLAHALLDDPALLGEPAAWWTELAAGPDGVAAVGRLPGGRLGWTCGGPLTAPGLPPGALVGVGAFADAAAEEALWLQLMRESAEHSPALADADLVAERAGTRPYVSTPAPCWRPPAAWVARSAMR
jgi:hypothetical protein